VLSLAGDVPLLLRPGGISRQEIEQVIGEVDRPAEGPSGAHPAPGMHPRHYSPKTRLVLVHEGRVPENGSGAYLQLHHSPARAVQDVVDMPLDAADYASQLYRILHELDSHNYDWIAVDSPEETAKWEAVLDRLKRAATE
jgi:L-threonylcarbamoyladenylate synthase